MCNTASDPLESASEMVSLTCVKSTCAYEGAVLAGSDNDSSEEQMRYKGQQNPSRGGGRGRVEDHTQNVHTGSKNQVSIPV